MKKKFGLTRQRTNNLRDELIWGCNSVRRQILVYHCTNTMMMAVIDIFNKKRKCCNHRCPDSYFYTLLLIIYLSVIEKLICRREMSLIRCTSFGFAQRNDT